MNLSSLIGYGIDRRGCRGLTGPVPELRSLRSSSRNSRCVLLTELPSLGVGVAAGSARSLALEGVGATSGSDSVVEVGTRCLEVAG